MIIYIENSRLNVNDNTVGKKLCKDVLLVDYLFLSSDVFPAIKYFDILNYYHYFLLSIAELVCICIHMSTTILLLKI